MPIRINQKGFSLIEVLVSMLIIGGGLIFLSSLQIRNTNLSMSAYVQTQATICLQDMVEKLHLNKVSAGSGNYNTSLISVNDFTSDSKSLEQTELYQWFDNLNAVLPSAKALINCSVSDCVVELQYVIDREVYTQSQAIVL